MPANSDNSVAESRQCAVCGNEITASSGEWWIPEQILHADDVTDHRAVYVRDWQAAAIRAPLEERIRELEEIIENAKQENARLHGILTQETDAARTAGSRAETAEAALREALVEIDGNPLRAIAIAERALANQSAESIEE